MTNQVQTTPWLVIHRSIISDTGSRLDLVGANILQPALLRGLWGDPLETPHLLSRLLLNDKFSCCGFERSRKLTLTFSDLLGWFMFLVCWVTAISERVLVATCDLSIAATPLICAILLRVVAREPGSRWDLDLGPHLVWSRRAGSRANGLTLLGYPDQ